MRWGKEQMAALTHLKDQKHHPVICLASQSKEGFRFLGLKADRQQPQFSVQIQMGLGQDLLNGSGQLPV